MLRSRQSVPTVQRQRLAGWSRRCRAGAVRGMDGRLSYSRHSRTCLLLRYLLFAFLAAVPNQY